MGWLARVLAPVTIAGAVLGATAVHGKTIASGSMTFTADLPCGPVCAQYLDLGWVSGKLEGLPFQACKAPFPERSFDDVVVTAPAGARTLIFKGYPEVDWDLFVCTKPSVGNNGTQLASSSNSLVVWDSDLPEVQCAVACVERIEMPVVAGKKYVLRAYNFSDREPLFARYWFKDTPPG